MTEIPIEGGSGKIKSGALKFENDWPGLFLRGDDCMFLAIEIKKVLKTIEDNKIKISTLKLKELEKLINNEVLIDEKDEI